MDTKPLQPLFPFIEIAILFNLLFAFLQCAHAKETELRRFPANSGPFVCLAMIVSNDSKSIESCLNSLKDIADCISISDIGSTDNTSQIVKEFIKKNHIPLQIHTHEWRNFAHNRALSASAAKETAAAFGLPLEETYLLLLDPDMLFMAEQNFRKSDLKADRYDVLQKTPSLSHYNTRFIRASLPWECIGVAYEFWSCLAPCQKASCKKYGLKIKAHHEDNKEKARRAIPLLIEGLKEEPDNERYLFYLAQSYQTLEQYDESIRWYKARIEKRGSKESLIPSS